jgi:hypothetical protein
MFKLCAARKNPYFHSCTAGEVLGKSAFVVVDMAVCIVLPAGMSRL